MASSSDKSVFREILVEEYKKRPKNIDVVNQKKENFKILLYKAHNELKSKNYFESKKSYLSIIEYIANDPYPDELNLSPDVHYCIKCCFCYSCLMDPTCTDIKYNDIAADFVKELSDNYSHRLFPKFLQVVLNYRKKNWATTLRWCNAVESHEEDYEEKCITVDISEAILPREPQIVAEVEMYEEKSFFNHWENLAWNRLAKSKNDKHQFLSRGVNIIMRLLNMDTSSELDLQRIFHGGVIPLSCRDQDGMFDCNSEEKDNSQCNICVKPQINNCDIIEESIHRNKINVEKFILKLLEVFSKMDECDFSSNFSESMESHLLNKIEEIQELVAQGTGIKEIKQATSEDTKHIVAQTQTDKLKTGNRCVQTEINPKNVRAIAQTQTDKLKTGSRCIQTEPIKTKNAEVQVNCDMQLINTVLDIKNKLLVNQEKKDDNLVKLNRKISELTDRLTKETNKRKTAEEDYQKKCTKQEVELKKMRDQLDENKRLRKEEREKYVSLQKLFVEQITEKFNIQKNMYKTFEKKSAFMVTYLKDISQFLTSTSIPNDTVVQQNIDTWENHLKKIQEDIDQLNTLYKKIRVDIINSEKFDFTWPEVPDFPRDEDNVIFVSFKPAIKNIVQIEEKLLKKFNTTVQPNPQIAQAQNIPFSISRPQYPIQSSSYFMAPRLIYPSLPQPMSVVATNIPQQCPTFTRDRIAYDNHQSISTVQHPPTIVDHQTRPNLNTRASRSTESLNRPADKDIRVTEVVDNRTPIVNQATASARCVEREDNKYQEKEKMLIEYVIENCPGATEDEVTIALLQVVDDNKGSLSKLPKEKVVEDVKMVLRMKKQSAWVMPKSPHVDWKNDHTESNCSICFEDFYSKETYTLPCQHEYHKECIKKWLKTKSVCPICRIHSVIDEEFPPLH